MRVPRVDYELYLIREAGNASKEDGHGGHFFVVKSQCRAARKLSVLPSVRANPLHHLVNVIGHDLAYILFTRDRRGSKGVMLCTQCTDLCHWGLNLCHHGTGSFSNPLRLLRLCL